DSHPMTRHLQGGEETMPTPDPVEIAERLDGNGLILRGGFNFAGGEDAPTARSGLRSRSVLLVGQAGGAPWPHFLRWKENQPQVMSNPLDTWSRMVIEEIATDFGAR